MAAVTLVEGSDALTHVAVSGRLDAAGVGEVSLRLTSFTVSRRRPAIVDLGEVTFIASIGIGMLVGIAKAMRSHHLPMAVVVTDPQVSRVLETAMLAAVFPIVGTREEALRTIAG